MVSKNLLHTGLDMRVAEIMYCQLKIPDYSFIVYSSNDDLNVFLLISVERRSQHVNIFYFEQSKDFVWFCNNNVLVSGQWVLWNAWLIL